MRLGSSVIRISIYGAAMAAIACGDGGGGGDAGEDAGTEFTCPDGVNPDGNGCLLPCADGWHVGPGGACLADCPSIAEENAAGNCGVASCPAGWALDDVELTTGETIHYCARDCPAGTTKLFDDCIRDCEDGWSMGADDRCHLDCPAGMSPGAAAGECAPDAAGEDEACPSETFDPDVAGPNPVYVDAEYGLDTNDGSEGAPFATIGHAVAAMGDSATIYLAAGVYPEWVLVEGKAELNLVGRCASDVRIEPPGPAPESHGDVAGAIQTFDTGTVRIHGVTVASPGYGIRIEHTGGSGEPVAATVDQVRVEAAAAQGVLASGAFDSITVANASVSQAAGGIACLGNTISTVVEVADSHVFDLLPGAASDASYVSAIEVDTADSAEITGNLVENLVRVVGISVDRTRTLTNIEGNAVRGLQGGAGVSGGLWLSGRRISDTFVTDIDLDSGGWDPLGEGTPIGIRLVVPGGETALISGTVIARVQGIGIEVVGTTSGDGELELTDSEIFDGTAGVVGLFDHLVMTGNRMDGLGSFLFAPGEAGVEESSDIVIQRNSFSARAAPAVAPPSGSAAAPAIDGYAVFVFGETLLFEENTMYDNAVIPEDTDPLHQLWFRGRSLAARDNSITHFDGNAIAADPGELDSASPMEVVVTGNRLLRGGDGLFLDGTTLPIDEVIIDGNEFGRLDENSVTFYWDLAHGAAQLTANTFLGVVPIVWGLGMADTPPGAGLVAADNHFMNSGVWIRTVQDLSFQNNLLTYAGLYVASQRGDSVMAVAGNAFRDSGLVLLDVAGATSVTGNGFARGDGYLSYGIGLAAIDSAGPLTVGHNVFSDTAAVEVASVGVVADGIQVVGGAAATPVDVRENLLRGNGRAGVLLHGATGIVEGNMYLDNGAGEEADFVLQASGEGAVTGWDTGFATVPDEPYGVLQKENLGWE